MNERHLKFFAEFCRYEKLTGGPDPHLTAVISMCKSLPVEEQVWRVALYVGFYNVPSAEAMWHHFPVQPGAAVIRRFLDQHWEDFRFRRERKSVALDSTHGERMTEYCVGAERVLNEVDALRDMTFEEVWRYAIRLPHVGRYAATKLCECWRRLGLVQAECKDIRAKEGWSPRTALNMICDEREDVHSDWPSSVARADTLATVLHDEHFKELSWFEFEVMLCEYKASYSTKRQYPGRSLDSELSYERAIHDYWYPGLPLDVTEHMQMRSRLHPSWELGEIQGWDPKERLANLGHVLHDYGYTWSDSLYNYGATTDFACPVRREQ